MIRKKIMQKEVFMAENGHWSSLWQSNAQVNRLISLYIKTICCNKRNRLQKCIRRIEIKFGIHSTLFLGFAGIAKCNLKFPGQSL